jgi:hypothetical protein
VAEECKFGLNAKVVAEEYKCGLNPMDNAEECKFELKSRKWMKNN